MSTDQNAKPGSLQPDGSAALGLCSWHEPRQCQQKATHYHHAYGTVCGCQNITPTAFGDGSAKIADCCVKLCLSNDKLRHGG